MKIVIIDGVEYVRKDTIIGQDSLDALAKIYSIAFCWAIYDPDDRVEHLRKVWELIFAVNQELRFRK